MPLGGENVGGEFGSVPSDYVGYCSMSDLESQLSKQSLAELSNDARGLSIDGAEPNEDVVTTIIFKADSEINSVLSGSYSVPFSTVPDKVRQISIDLSAYYLMRRRFSANEVPKSWTDAFLKAQEDLVKIASLEVTVPGAVSNNSAAKAVPMSENRTFGFTDDDNPLSMF
jgi:phage gp36-like protein